MTTDQNDTSLDGATTPGPENAWPANAGDFAARWNACTPEEREEWTAAMYRNAQDALACFIMNHKTLEDDARILRTEVVRLQSGMSR